MTRRTGLAVTPRLLPAGLLHEIFEAQADARPEAVAGSNAAWMTAAVTMMDPAGGA